MQQVKITAMIPNAIDVLSFYRAMGPLKRMMKDNKNVHVTVEENFNWAKMSCSDILFAQRPYKPEHLQVIKMAKRWGIPVVVDYDDNLFDLKMDNPAWKNYTRNDGVVKCIQEIPQLADIVFVTTEHLKRIYEERGAKNVIVVPNAYDSTLFAYAKEPLMDRRKIVLWRGSDTHVHDCMTVGQGWDALIRKHTDWIFAFMNQAPWFLADDLKQAPNVAFFDGLEILDYFKFIHTRTPAIMTHPLSDSTFNRAKSLACFLEASHANAAFVGPDFEEFDRPGCVKYKPHDSKDFFDKIDGLITNPSTILESAKTARSYIAENLELGVVNKIRHNAFLSLL